jgi:hypothetical protein
VPYRVVLASGKRRVAKDLAFDIKHVVFLPVLEICFISAKYIASYIGYARINAGRFACEVSGLLLDYKQNCCVLTYFVYRASF